MSEIATTEAFDLTQFYNPLLAEILKSNIFCYDLEIKRMIELNKEKERLPFIEYCEGFHDFSNMGISTMAAYQTVDDRYRLFMDDNKAQAADAISKADLIVTYNGIRFDHNLLKAEWAIEYDQSKEYDLLHEIWRSLGIADQDFDKEMHSGYGLDKMAKANLGFGKTDQGVFAPLNYQVNRIGYVADYNLGDVARTWQLFLVVCLRGWLYSPKDGSRIQMRNPFTKP